MTSTVLDVTVLLLCVSASVVMLGGVGDGVRTHGPSVDETADRLVTETVTVRYRAPEAANGTRTVHATRAELLALLVTDADGDGDRTWRNSNATVRDAFESRAIAAITAGLDGRTRVDVTVPTAAKWRDGTPRGTSEWRAPNSRGSRRAAGPTVVSRAPNARRVLRSDAVRPGSDSQQAGESRSAVSADTRSVGVGVDPPRSADVTTTVVTHPVPDAAETKGPVRIVVRRW